MDTKISKKLYWTPRILGIFYILFLAMFSLDVLGTGLSFRDTLIAFFMHNLPSLVLLVVLLIAWRYEIVGAIAFTLGGLLYIGLLLRNPFEYYMIAWAIQIAGPAFFTGYLFWRGWRKKRKPENNQIGLTPPMTGK